MRKDARGGPREGSGRPPGNSARKSFWIPRDVLAELKNRVKRTGETSSEVVVRALRQELGCWPKEG